jgi:DNA-binding CsgD family transcriptional regulator
VSELDMSRAAQKAVALAQQEKSTWPRADLVKYLGRVLPRSGMEPAAAAALLEDLADRALRSEFEPVVCLEAPEAVQVPRGLLRADGRSVYQRQLAARARGLLAEPAHAEAHFGKSLSHPAGDGWPFERAQLQLDYGEWLRRQRRINDAKPVLTAALETFRRLGAALWTQRTEAELRACGVTTEAPTVPDALAELTMQQREIVILASRGLTNGEIADRLFLSPRTVASHLYRSYPRLGIAGRHQLRDLIEQAQERPTAPPASS